MGSPKQEVRLEGRIEMHLGSGYSKLAVRIGGTRTIDIQTEKIPVHLRAVGTKVLVILKQGSESFQSLSGDTRYHYNDVVITDLPDEVQLGWFPADQ